MEGGRLARRDAGVRDEEEDEVERGENGECTFHESAS